MPGAEVLDALKRMTRPSCTGALLVEEAIRTDVSAAGRRRVGKGPHGRQGAEARALIEDRIGRQQSINPLVRSVAMVRTSLSMRCRCAAQSFDVRLAHGVRRNRCRFSIIRSR